MLTRGIHNYVHDTEDQNVFWFQNLKERLKLKYSLIVQVRQYSTQFIYFNARGGGNTNSTRGPLLKSREICHRLRELMSLTLTDISYVIILQYQHRPSL